MSKLVIVESPAKAKTINRYLGTGYKVRASMGHVRDLPKSEMGVDIEKDFAPTYQVLKAHQKLITQLRKLARSSEEVFLATDLDREGEAIAWHLAEALRLPKKKTRRVVFNEITKNAIRKAFEQPGDIDENKVNAQQARRILDRIVGYRLSPLLWTKLRRGLSAGRVQSVTVRLIVEREREIEAFKIEEYWEIEAELSPAKLEPGAPRKFRAKLAKLDGQDPKIPNEASAAEVVKKLQSLPFIVTGYEEKERAMQPPPPFNTSTLQQQASIRLRFSTKKTMMIAQQLYEGVDLGPEGSVGLITYMRTDSFRVAGQAIGECRKYIAGAFSPEYLPEKARQYRAGRGAQGAHEAVRPTSASRTPESVKEYLTRDQFRLYELIWKRFVASQMAAGRLAVRDGQIAAGDALFTAQGRQLVFDGHLKISGYDKKNDMRVPRLTPEERLKLLGLEPTQHFTKPPPRYTEATLVKTLEKLGIGRPSTYAPTISTIQQRKYVELMKRQFHATELGKLVTDQLVEHFKDIMNVEFTSHMEERLDEVEEAKADWLQILREFYKPFAADLKRAEKNMKRPEPEKTEFKCELCGKPMLKRWGKRGMFLGCSGYPECTFTQPLDEEGKPAARPEPEVSDEKCEKCGAPMVVRTGPHGRFLGCSAYPKCKNTRKLQPERETAEEGKSPARPEPEPTDEKCEKCGAPMVVRTGRRGRFLACSAFPKCKNTRSLGPESDTATQGKPAARPKLEPTDEKCEKCGAPMVVRAGRRGRFLGCSAYPKCRNTKPLPKDAEPSASNDKDPS